MRARRLAASRARQTKEVLCDGQLQFPLSARVSWKLGQREERFARGGLRSTEILPDPERLPTARRAVNAALVQLLTKNASSP